MIRSHLIRSAAAEERRAPECSKAGVDPALLRDDCAGCQERKFCALRANTVIDRSQVLTPRVQFIAELHSRSKILRLGLSDLRSDEVGDMILFQSVLNEVEEQLRQESAKSDA